VTHCTFKMAVCHVWCWVIKLGDFCQLDINIHQWTHEGCDWFDVSLRGITLFNHHERQFQFVKHDLLLSLKQLSIAAGCQRWDLNQCLHEQTRGPIVQEGLTLSLVPKITRPSMTEPVGVVGNLYYQQSNFWPKNKNKNLSEATKHIFIYFTYSENIFEPQPFKLNLAY